MQRAAEVTKHATGDIHVTDTIGRKVNYRKTTERTDAMNKVTNQPVKRDIGVAKGTFEVSVKFLRNATWQGQIHWIEKEKEQTFRSVLEMLKLMDEALTELADEEETVGWNSED